MDVSGATRLDYTLYVKETATIHGDLDISGSKFTIKADTGNVRTLGTLGVSGAVDLDNNLDVSGATHLETTLDVSGATRLDNTLYVKETATIHGD